MGANGIVFHWRRNDRTTVRVRALMNSGDAASFEGVTWQSVRAKALCGRC
jgi:hypothetical protein